MAEVKIALKEILNLEGGYSDNPHDRGGKTNYGITKWTAIKHGYFGSMKRIPLELVNKIYIKSYWDKLRLSEVDDQDIANELFDISVNCGQGTAARYLQRTLNTLNRNGKDWKDIKVDGKVGQITISTLSFAVHRLRKINILKCLNILQGALYLKLAENPNRFDEDFINGWLRRIKLY